MSHRKGGKGKTHSNKVADSTEWQWDDSCNRWYWLTTNPRNVQERIYWDDPETSTAAEATIPRASDSHQSTENSDTYTTSYSSSSTAAQGYGAFETLEGSFQNLNISPATITNNSGIYNAGRDITSDPGWEYIREGKRWFKVGRVFKCIWAEPTGYLVAPSTKEGGGYFSKVRHFVVVREQLNCCTCVAMHTYGGQGTANRGVSAQDHAAVFRDGGQPPNTAGEMLSKQSLPIIVETSGETIHPRSRINFGRTYTVEHNIKVMNVGRIKPTYISLLETYFNQVFNGFSEYGSEQSSGQQSGMNYQASSSVPSYSSYATPAPNGGSSNYYPGGLGTYSTYNQPQESRYMKATSVESDALDGSYKVRNHDYKKFFRQGRVFATLWAEPWPTDNKTKIRQFVVVKQAERSCTCLQVLSGRDSEKRVTSQKEHGIIYSGSKSPPRPADIKKDSVKVILSKGASHLASPSYVDYGRPYTVETIVKVKDIGDLDTPSRRLLRRYFNEACILDDSSDGGGAEAAASVQPANVSIPNGAGAYSTFNEYDQYPQHNPDVTTFYPSNGGSSQSYTNPVGSYPQSSAYTAGYYPSGASGYDQKYSSSAAYPTEYTGYPNDSGTNRNGGGSRQHWW